jgi:hypothetical protein
MHECVSDLSFLPRGDPDLTTDDTPLRHPHDKLVRHAVPSQTAGPGALGLKPVSITPSPPSTAPPAPPLRFQNSSVQAVVVSPTTTGTSRADHPPLDPFSTARDGSSKPPYLFKTTTVHHRALPPSTTASRSPRIQPLLEVLSAAVNGSPRPVSLNKTTTEHDPPSPPSTTAFLDPRGPLLVLPLVTVDGSSRTATTDRSDTRRDPVTSRTPLRLTTAHSGRLPGREADSFDPGC